jgi:hypothetical protein
MARGCSLSFGKIVLMSEAGDDMTSLVGHLGKILAAHGYPEQEKKVNLTQQDEARKAFVASLEKTKKERDWVMPQSLNEIKK